MATETAEPPRDALASLRIDRSLKPSETKRNAGRKWVLYFLFLLLLFFVGTVLAIYQGWLPTESWQAWLHVPDAIRNRPEVRVVQPTVERGRSADATVVATGYLESRRQAKIGARAVGRVQTLNVEEGTRVKKDDILAVLEHSDLDASLAATAANLARAVAAVEEQKVLIQQNLREFERATGLMASRSISKTEFDQAKFDYESSLARLKSMEADVSLSQARQQEAQQIKENMFIRAPFDGTVISKDAEVGESIMPGGMGEASGRGSAVTIADLEHLEVDCDVKEDYIARVAVGQAAEVAVDAVPGHRFQGTVRKIIPMGDRARATIKVKVSITDADSRLFPNMSSTVYFLPSANSKETESEQDRIFCPKESVIRDEQSELVWVVDEKDHAQIARVVVGNTRDDRTEILRGLSGDERVIVNPPQLVPDQPVKITQ